MREATRFWDALKTKVQGVVNEGIKNCLKAKYYDVTTAPSSGAIGVTEPFGNTELLIPYSWMCASASTGDSVLVVWHGSLSTAKAWFIGNGPPSSLSLSAMPDGVVIGSSLWTNQNPTSAYASQTLTLDLSEYQMVGAEFMISGSEQQIASNICEMGKAGRISICTDSGYGYRAYTVSTTGITFQDAYLGSSATNSYCIPYKIYGIRGID